MINELGMLDACAEDTAVRKAERLVMFILGLLCGGVLGWLSWAWA